MLLAVIPSLIERGVVTNYVYSDYITWIASHAPWTVSSVYPLGADLCAILLK